MTDLIKLPRRHLVLLNRSYESESYSASPTRQQRPVFWSSFGPSSTSVSQGRRACDPIFRGAGRGEFGDYLMLGDECMDKFTSALTYIITSGLTYS